MKPFLARFSAIVFAVLYAASVNAGFVDIDGLTGTPENAVTVNLQETDTLVVTPIGVADGGAYDAFSFFNFTDGCNSSGSSCQYGYTWFLGFYLDGDPEQEGTFFSPASLNAARDYFIFQRDPVDSLGMAQAVSDNFTITGATSVSFYIADNYFDDNRGGLSFEYKIIPGVPVPAPTPLILLVPGLLLLAARRKSRTDLVR